MVDMTKAQLEKFMTRYKLYLAIRIVNNLVRRCPVDTGFLREHIGFKLEGKDILITMPKYGIYVEYGTPPHIIEAKNGKALRFEWTKQGNDMIGRKKRLEAGIPKSNTTQALFKRVHHPGTEAQPFVRPTLRDDIKEIAREAYLDALAEAT